MIKIKVFFGKEKCTLLHALKFKLSNFRMEHNTTLNISCNFNAYLVYQMPMNTVEVELKNKKQLEVSIP